jgi:hypothetical protein
MSLLQKPRKGQSYHKYVIDFQSIAISKKSKNDFSEGIHIIDLFGLMIAYIETLEIHKKELTA